MTSYEVKETEVGCERANGGNKGSNFVFVLPQGNCREKPKKCKKKTLRAGVDQKDDFLQQGGWGGEAEGTAAGVLECTG